MDTFRFRLNCIDHYQATPTELDPQLRRGSGASQRQNAPPLPVIRVFGATETGQKVCAHIHGALPYLYLQYNGSLEPESVKSYLNDLRASIDHALAVSYRRHPYDGKAVFVGHITLVKGVPFYGYNVGYKVFLKVHMLNPLHMTRLADLLVQGAIMNQVLQPYESHLQYLLQWMCDYNLYGCAYINCAKVQFRGPIPEYAQMDSPVHKWHDGSIPDDLVINSDHFPRQSHCSIEVDVCVQDILNRNEVSQRPIHHDFIERNIQLGPEDKFVPSMAGLWKDETRRRKRRMGLSDPSSSPFPPEVLVSMSADPRNTSKGGWIHEEEYRELIEELIQEEKGRGQHSTLDFDTFVRPIEALSQIKTAAESIGDLFPETLQASDPFSVSLDGDTTVDSSSSMDLERAQQLPRPFAENGGTEVTDDLYEDNGHASNGIIEEDYTVPHDEVDEQSGDRPLQPLDAAVESSESGPFAEAQVNEGLSSSGEGLHTDSDGGVSKKRALLAKDGPSNKRLKFTEASPAMRSRNANRDGNNTHRHVAFQEGNVGESMSGSQTSGDGPPRASQASQSSIKAHGLRGASTLSFPVVKNPNDPDTILRLSQAGYSNSQETPRTPGSKGVKTDSSKESPVTPWSHQKVSPITHSNSTPVASAAARSLIARLSSKIETRCAPTLFYGQLPPSAEMVEVTMMEVGLPPVIYQDAYYSDEADVPERAREYAGKEFKLESTTVPYLPPFDPSGQSAASFGENPPIVVDKTKEEASHRLRQHKCTLRHWEIASTPPSFSVVEQWSLQEKRQSLRQKEIHKTKPAAPSQKGALSQIEGPTQKNKYGFKYSQKQKSTSVKHETQYMSILSLEVHVNSRGTLAPDPAQDEIACIFWCIQEDEIGEDGNGLRVGVLALSDEDGIVRSMGKQLPFEVEYEEDELDLLNRMVDIVRAFDPDILTGYEVHNGSWGYLIERARVKYQFDLCDEFSRMKSQSHGRFGKDADRWGFTHTSTINVTGRHMINVWRAMRGELNLLQYTMENVAFHLLHKRIPHYSFQDLTAWYRNPKPRDLAKVLDYFISRTQLNLEILEVNEIVPRTSEQARLLGVDFFSVISRGSQFKVESTMFRIAKPENFIMASPSRKQVGQQNALECLPLVMEPQSAFYNSPLLVLDFQSLYPSVMIAYNYCYSTCLGRIVSWRGRNKMGFMDFKREPQLLELVKDYINIAPNGMMYVKPEMRKSLLAKMLGEILETRVMVKSGMKQDKDDKTLQQLLNNRQLALKLLANVTYGYASASFSGRMPCSEIADSIVQTGRETLEKAIALIHSVEHWGAEVVYGDTDSLFVYLKGRTRDQAFTIGEEIAEAVTKANPRPIKLKFEKVYHPCVLLAKKRYVGFKYESRNQKEPDFDAKGIETVRRDGTPAVQKIEEKALKLLFRTSDLSEVKRYFQSQCTKIMEGRISIQDFLFAKEVKLGTYSDKGPPPPGALIATKRMLADPRAEPQYGERVPFVVVTGAPGARLMDRSVAPETLLQDDHLELDAEYYISKNIIPPLERIFNLVGANVKQWYDEMPKVQRIRNITVPLNKQELGNGNALVAGVAQIGALKKTLESYMKSSTCIVCRAKLPPLPPNVAPGDLEPADLLPLCASCLTNPANTLYSLRTRVQKSEERAKKIDAVCRCCSGLAFGEEIKCDSRDCPVFYTRVRERAKLAGLREGAGRVIEALEVEQEEEVERQTEDFRAALEW